MANNNDLITFEDLQASMQRVKTEIDNATIDSEIKQIENQAIASFTDGVEDYRIKDLDVDLAIQQDLHGYDKPWPPGGGKNLCSVNEYSGTQSAELTLEKSIPAGTYIVSALPTSSDTDASTCLIMFRYSNNNYTNGLQYSRGTRTDHQITFTSEVTKIALYASDTNAHSAGDTFTFKQIMVETGSTMTDYAPYSNISPIYPHTEVEVTRAGKNFLNPSAFLLNTNYNGTALTGRSCIIYKVPAGTYKASCSNGTSLTEITVGVSNKPYPISSLDSVTTKTNITNNSSVTLVVDEAHPYLFVVCIKTSTTMSVTDIANAKIQIELGSTATAYEPYAGQKYLTNISINQWDEQWESGYISTTGVLTDESISIRSKNYNACLPDTQYYGHSVGGKALNVAWYDSSKTFIQRDSLANTTKSSPANAYFFKLSLNQYGSSYNNDISLNYPSRFTEYYSYTGNTVYGGTLDVDSGLLTVKYGSVDLGSLTWTKQTNLGTTRWVTANGAISNAQNSGTTVKNTYCERYDWHLNGNLWVASQMGWVVIDANLRLIVADDTSMDATAFKALVTGCPLVYTLATPTTIQLTPQEVTTLLNINNIWADSGNIVNLQYRSRGILTDEYIPDIVEMINDLVASAEDTQAIANIFSI